VSQSSPRQLAAFDQAYAAAAKELDVTIATYKLALAASGQSREAGVLDLVGALTGGAPETIGTLLAVAIDRLIAREDA
jgi:hypothetical protein